MTGGPFPVDVAVFLLSRDIIAWNGRLVKRKKPLICVVRCGPKPPHERFL